MKKHESEVLGRTGGGPLFPVADASITVYVRNEDGTNGAKAVLYSDNGVTEKGNPVTSDRAGEYWYYAADGRYNEVISGAGIDTRTISDVLLEDPADEDADIAALQGSVAELDSGKASLAQLAASSGSALVGFAQSGIGAAVRTLLQKLRDSVSVKDFGAVGDGSTDDTAAIQAVIDALSIGLIDSIARQRRLYLPAGVYKTSAALTISTVNFTMVGDGPQQSVIKGDHASGHVLSITAGGDVAVEGIAITATATRIAGAASASSCGINGDGSTSTTQYRVILRDVYVQDQPGHGIAAYNPELWQLERCVISGSKKSGVYMFGRNLTGISNLLLNTRSRQNAEYGYYLENVEESTLLGAQGLDNALDQCNIASGWGITLIEPDLEAYGIVTSGTSLVGLRMAGKGHKVIGGRFYGLNTGIRLAAADNCLVMNPRIDGTASVAITTGIFVDASSDQNQIHAYAGTNVTTLVSNTAGGTRNSVYEDGRITLSGLALAQSSETYAASFTPDLSKGSNFALTLTGNITINAPSGMRQGQVILFTFTQDGTGGRTVTWNGAWKQTWVDTGNTAGKRSTIAFLSLGTGTAQQLAAQGPYVS